MRGEEKRDQKKGEKDGTAKLREAKQKGDRIGGWWKDEWWRSSSTRGERDLW